MPAPSNRLALSRRAAVLVGVGVLIAFGAGAPARAADPTERALTIDVTVGPANDTHCTVDANLFTPAGASASHPVPAILATNGFGGTKADFDTLGASYARRGFAFLAYSGLGFGASGCKIELDDPDWDGKAGSQLVSFLGGSKAATDGTRLDYIVHDATAHDGRHYPDDPRVGMLGGSYGGEVQFSVAEQDPRVDALNPQITWNDLSYSLLPNNTSLGYGVTYTTPGVVKLDWPLLFFGVGAGQGIAEGLRDPSHLGLCPNFDDRVCSALLGGATTGFPDDATLGFLRHASVASYLDGIRIPTFLVQGQTDSLFDIQEAVATYRGLRAQGTPVQMLWRSSGHSGGSLGSAESDDADPEAGYESRLELRWFEHYLLGAGPPPRLDFTFLRPWVPYHGDAAAAVGDVPSYPAGADHGLYLSGSDGLASDPASVRPGLAGMLEIPVAPTGTGAGVGNLGALDLPGTSITYSTPPLGADTDVVGVPRLTVSLQAPTFAVSQSLGPPGELVLFAKLEDYDPATGTTTIPDNLVSAARVADVSRPLTIQLPGISHRFPRGHQLRLGLSTGALSFHGGDALGPVSVPTSPTAPGVLTLPELAGPVASLAEVDAGVGAAGCVDRRHFTVPVVFPHRGRVIVATAYVDGRRSATVRGRALRRIVLRRLPLGTFVVRVVARTTRGGRVSSTRTYRGCGQTRRRDRAAHHHRRAHTHVSRR